MYAFAQLSPSVAVVTPPAAPVLATPTHWYCPSSASLEHAWHHESEGGEHREGGLKTGWRKGKRKTKMKSRKCAKMMFESEW